MQRAVEVLLADLDSLTSETDFRRKLASTFDVYGFDTYTYAGIDAEDIRDAAPGQPYLSDLIYLSNLKAEWIAHYLESDYAHLDPIVRTCTEARLPLSWDENERPKYRNQLEAEMMDDAWENGLRRGFTVPVHGPRGELGIFSLNSSQNDQEFRRNTELKRFEIQILAYHFHDAIQRKLKINKVSALPVPLTAREVEILKWTVEGKTAWEIGQILKISERTVNYHLQNVMNKFGVHNKTHAASKALHMGLLTA